jgi:hypothetical protein
VETTNADGVDDDDDDANTALADTSAESTPAFLDGADSGNCGGT